MKTKKGCMAIMALLIITFYLKPTKTSAQEGAPVSFQVFYDNLAPFGQWTEMPNYGYVWLPNVGPGFVPYATNGYWANTDMGWTWVSNYEWGWAPFHYGRWERDYNLGWFWVPGYEWAPAWVVWRQSPGYFGWAPMRPGIEISAVSGGFYNPEPSYWVFANEHYMGDRYIYNYYAPASENVVIINKSSFIRETYVDRENRGITYIYGPRREIVERSTGAPVNRVVFVERSEPGHAINGNKISIYRPRIENRPGGRPARVEEVRNIRPERERQENYQRTHPEGLNRENHQGEIQRQDHINPGVKTETQPQQNNQRSEPRMQNQPVQRQQQQQNQSAYPKQNNNPRNKRQQNNSKIKAQKSNPKQNQRPGEQPR